MHTTIKELFERLEHNLERGLPFVIFKHPDEDQLTLITENNDDICFSSDFMKEGFFFAPFQYRDNALFFSLKHHYKATLSPDFYKEGTEPDENKGSEVTGVEMQKEKHVNMVQQAVAQIKKGFFKKVVLSRKETIDIKEIDYLQLYKMLLSTYKSAFVYWWYHPKVGMWMGASPETLLSIDDDKFKTMSLAGTQLDRGCDDVVWEAKEIEEQQLVTDYIVAQLKTIAIQPKTSDVRTVKAGSLLHLCTDISGSFTKDDLGKIINVLHPTPAVCGYPKKEATSFIIKNESYDREFYTGFMGMVTNTKNRSKEARFYVNLRCMQLKENSIDIYVGGGITSDSVPEKEWEETINKSKIMKKVLS